LHRSRLTEVFLKADAARRPGELNRSAASYYATN
jgi:hypothetical protein